MGRKSRIDLIPESARAALQEWLSTPAISQAEATEALHDLLDATDWSGPRPSVSAVNRYAQRFSETMRRRREANEVAQHWVNQFGRVPQGQLGQLIVQMIQGMAFDRMVQLDQTSPDPEDPKAMGAQVGMLRDLAQMIERTERAASLNAERERKLRAELAEEAANVAETAARAQGVSEEGVEAIGKAVRIYLPDNHRQGATASA
jgi:hypothetical protein